MGVRQCTLESMVIRIPSKYPVIPVHTMIFVENFPLVRSRAFCGFFFFGRTEPGKRQLFSPIGTRRG